MIPRLKEQFRNELKSTVMDQLSLENVNEIPTLEKIVINIGDGKAATDGRALEFRLLYQEFVTSEALIKNPLTVTETIL